MQIIHVTNLVHHFNLVKCRITPENNNWHISKEWRGPMWFIADPFTYVITLQHTRSTATQDYDELRLRIEGGRKLKAIFGFS
jgi:hypothetical protein